MQVEKPKKMIRANTAHNSKAHNGPTRKISCVLSRPFFTGQDPIRGSGREVAEISPVESGDNSKSCGSAAVKSAVYHSSRVGTGHPDPRVNGDPTREKNVYFQHFLWTLAVIIDRCIVSRRVV